MTRQQNPTPTEPKTTIPSLPDSLAHAARRRRFEAGQTLYAQGDEPEGMLYVLSGELCLVRHSSTGDEITIQRSGGGFIAEASMDTPAYHCDVKGTRAGELLIFPRADFRDALESDPAFNREWIAHLGRELRGQRARNERLALKTAEARIRHYIESEGENGRITLSRTRKAWAAELGLTHETLYRALKRLSSSGRVKMAGDTIEISPASQGTGD